MNEYRYEKHGRHNWFYTIIRNSVHGIETKCYTRFYGGAIEVTTCSGGYRCSRWIKGGTKKHIVPVC